MITGSCNGYGHVAELADAQDLGSCPERGGGSSPSVPSVIFSCRDSHEGSRLLRLMYYDPAVICLACKQEQVRSLLTDAQVEPDLHSSIVKAAISGRSDFLSLEGE